MQLISQAEAPAGPRDVIKRACPERARASWGDQIVAETDAAIRLEEGTQAPLLLFPLEDVDLQALVAIGDARCPVKGTVQLWSAGRPLQSGTEVLAWTFTDPPADLSWIKDWLVFDHDLVRVELVDTSVDPDLRAASVKRFPTWGDASDLIGLMRVRPEGALRYVGPAYPDGRRPVVEGSQMLGQALMAAGHHLPGRRAVSAHMVFTRTADSRKPLTFDLEELSAGRTFSTLGVRVTQNNRLCAVGTLLLDVTAPDLIRHQAEAPACAGPLDSESYDMSVTGRDIRVVDGAYTNDPEAPVGPPILDAWVRFRPLGSDDSALHTALMAQFTGHMSIAAALRPHAGIGQAQAHRTISTGVSAITLALHGEVRADQWLRYHHHATFAGDGMVHSECRVYDEQGTALASFVVDGMVRGFGDRTGPVDASSTL